MLWNTVIATYSKSHLTKKSDKLAALSGIVKYIQPIFTQEYLAGIWSGDIHRYLGWYCPAYYNDRLLPRCSLYKAPTWSWASTDNPVEIMMPYNLDCSIPVLKILHAETMPTANDVTSSISAGHLLVQGPLNRVILSSPWGGLSIDGVSLNIPPPDYDEPRSHILGSKQEVEAYTLPLFYFCYQRTLDKDPYDAIDKTDWDLMFFILRESSESPGHYVRIGLGGSTRSGIHDKLMRVCNASNAPCEEFLGDREGHRIKII